MISKFWKSKEKKIIFHKNKLNIIENIDKNAKEIPDNPALLFDNGKNIKKYSYLELEKEINKFSNLLNSLKIKENSRVFIFLPKCPEVYISILSIIKQGSIAIPLFEAFKKEGLELRLKKGDADVLITNKKLYKRFKKIKPKINLKVLIIDDKKYKNLLKKQSIEFKPILKNKKDTAFMIFTSSTAGTPVAGIEISHYSIVQQYFTAELVLNLKKSKKYWCTAHPGWVTGMVYGILAPLSIGSSVYVYEPHFDAKKWINFIKKNKIQVIYTAPTALRLLRDKIKKSDLKSIENICSVGEALTETIFSHYKKLGIEINDTYWQTETGAIVIASYPGLKKKKASIGKAIPGIKAYLKNEVIALKPDFPSLMTGIYKHKKMYKSYFKNNLFITNDMAELKNNYFYFKQRKDDIIKTSGERVSPIEIENILMKHKKVKEAAVIGIPDKLKGQIIKAFIVLNGKGDKKLKKELSLFVKKEYAGHSYPKIIEFIDKLPKTNSGKIIRMKLRKN